jgi:hypothetical protein
MHLLTTAVVLLTSVVAYGSCYSSGAPPSEEICSTLRPNHPGEPQTETFPYKLVLDKREVKTGQNVTLGIRSNSQKFKGFLVQARRVGAKDSDLPVGSWINDKNPASPSKTVNCGDLLDSAITHSNGEEKTRVNLKWTAPKEPGTYVFM